MRENRLSGSEGGGPEPKAGLPTPIPRARSPKDQGVAMSKRAGRRSRKQEVSAELPEAIAQLVMPMVAGMQVAKTGLLAFVHAVGRAALGEVFEEEVTRLRGRRASCWPIGRHIAGATHTPCRSGSCKESCVPRTYRVA